MTVANVWDWGAHAPSRAGNGASPLRTFLLPAERIAARAPQFAREARALPGSEFLRIFQQLDYALEQTRCASAVDAAMIEAQRDLRFSFGNEFLFRLVPRRGFFPGTESKEQSLIGQGNRRAPFNPERSEI